MAITIIAYQPVWRAGFVWDDHRHIVENPQLVAPDGLKQIWSSRESPQFYPLVFTTFWLERALWELNPAPYHWLNLLLHAGSAVVLWRLLKRLRLRGAWLAAVLFALHPVNVESVAWISQRKNTLSMFFYLITALFYVRSEQDAEGGSGDSGAAGQRSASCPSSILHPPALLFYWLSLGAFALALLSKTATAPLPLVLLGLAWWQRGRVGWRDVRRSAPFFAAALILGLITVWFERHVNADQLVRTDSFWSRLAVAGCAVWFYLSKALLPLDLMPVYPMWNINAARLVSYLPGVLVVAGTLVCFCYRRPWGRAWFFCVGYFVTMLLPVLGFENIGFMKASLVADHWQYFAVIAPIALVSAGLAASLGAAGKASAGLVAGGCGALVLGLGVLTWRLSAIYTSPETFWRAAVAGNPGYGNAQGNLGVALLERGRFAEALPHLQKALELQPDDALARSNFGNALRLVGRTDEAAVHLQKALEVQPDLVEAHVNLGTVLLAKGQTQAALAHYQKAVELEPNLPTARIGLANLLSQTGKPDEAINQLEKALEAQPDNVMVHNNLGNLLRRKGQVDAAIAHYQKAITLQPRYANAHYNLGNALWQKGLIDAAIREYQTALEIQPGLTAARRNIATLLARKGETGGAPVPSQTQSAEPPTE